MKALGLNLVPLLSESGQNQKIVNAIYKSQIQSLNIGRKFKTEGKIFFR